LSASAMSAGFGASAGASTGASCGWFIFLINNITLS
jgi:hypothetical protein